MSSDEKHQILAAWLKFDKRIQSEDQLCILNSASNKWKVYSPHLESNWCKRRGAAYNSFLNRLCKISSMVNTLLRNANPPVSDLTRVPKTFAQMKLINAINGV